MGRVLVVLVIIALAIFCLAFIGIFGRFPDEWEWIGIILAGMALAMATPSIFQMLWGRPLLEMQFEEYVENKERVLLIFLKNPPVKRRILRILGVRREAAQSITVEFRILEVGSNRIIVPIRQARIYSDDDPTDEGRNRISLPATYSVAASVILIRWDTQEKKAFVAHDRLRQELPLEYGQYQADVILIVDGDPKIIHRQFVVGKKADDLVWIKPS